MRTTIARIGLIVGALTLLVHAPIYIPIYMAEGLSLFAALVRQYSYFTILTNLGLVLIFASVIFSKTNALKMFRNSVARATGAAAISLVALYYHFVLSPIWNPEGLAAVTDTFLHYINPAIYVAWFIAFNRSGELRFKHFPLMIAAPVLYLAYIFVRGAFIGEYPYPAFDLNELGWRQIVLNSAELLVFLGVLCLVMIGIDRFKPNPFLKSEKRPQ